MQTDSILIQSLFVPCACRCRYCLLSWDGNAVGVPWERSKDFALRFRDWIRVNRDDLRFSFAFGYSMEHPSLEQALPFLREIGSPQAEFLQCDGLRMRTEEECRSLMKMLAREGVRHLNFTFYGLEDYHDRFAGRKGDFALLLRMLDAACKVGLAVSTAVPLTEENLAQAEELFLLLRSRVESFSFFIPHEEGRGRSLDAVRLTERSLLTLPSELREHMNREIFRPEKEWINEGYAKTETRRMLLVSLRQDTITRYEALTPEELIAELEELDEAYYAAFPSFTELAELYGNRNGDRMFRQRDLFAFYRRQYREKFPISVYDVTDESRSGSRRY